MVTFRGFLQRTLPALLALVLAGFSAAPALGSAPVVSGGTSHRASTTSAYAASRDATTASSPATEEAAASDPGAGVVDRGGKLATDAPQALRPQPAAGVRGSRAPPSTLA